MTNPFSFGILAEKDNFIDRVEDRRLLKSYLTSNINIILMSPRRIGKSSLVKQCTQEILNERNDVKVCHLDVFPIKSVNQFYKKFSEAVIKGTSSSWEQWIIDTKEFIKTIVPKISLGTDPLNEFSLSFDFSNDDHYKTDLLELPEKIAVKKGCKVIVCIDEFQSLAHLDGFEELEQNMRSVWQHHSHSTYCLYGSNRHMMSDIFNSSEKPFYRFGQMMNLKKIAEKDWVDYIIRMFDKTGKSIEGRFASEIATSVQCHSYYVQQFAAAVWYYTTKEVTQEIVDKGLQMLIETNSESYHTAYSTLSANQVNLLFAIMNKEPQLTSSATIKKYDLGSPALVNKNKKALLRRDFIESTSAHLSILDPVFEIWLKGLM